MTDYLIIIQARIGSTRLPNKVMQMVGGKTILNRVWEAAKALEKPGGWFNYTFKAVVAWPERYPDVDESNVLERFRRISHEFPSKYIIRLTSDCPLLSTSDIKHALTSFYGQDYYSNHRDGHDVQIFTSNYLWDNLRTSREHVIADFSTPSTGLSVNTTEDLERVRRIADAR